MTARRDPRPPASPPGTTMPTLAPPRRPLRRLALGGAAVLVGLVAALGTARAEDAPSATEVRCFDVLDLVRERPSFTRERGPYPSLPDEVNDENRPLFGGEREEGTRPLGSPDELVELLKATAGAPGAWEAEGTSIATDGPWRLVVAGPPPLLDAVAKVLDGLRARLLTTYAVDVALFVGDPSTVTDADLVGRIGRGSRPSRSRGPRRSPARGSSASTAVRRRTSRTTTSRSRRRRWSATRSWA